MKFDLRFVRSESASKLLSRRRRILRTAIVTLALVALGFLVYRDFIFGNRTLLYKDIGADSVIIYYPRYVLVSDYIRHEGIPSWSFRVGMGQNIFPSLSALLITPVVWLAKEAIAKALVYQHLLYVVISGLLFERFLADRGLAFASCLLGGLLLSFSAYMCMGSCWYFHASEVVCFTFLLFAAEQAASRGRWIYLVPAVTIVGFLGAFHLYLGVLLLCFYVPARLIERFSWQPLPIFRICVALAAAAVLGAGLGAILSVNSFYTIVNSPRGSGPTSLVSTLSSLPVFGLESSSHYITAVLRPFGNDMMGTGDDFRGWQNYLEAPMSYCGLLCLLIFPQIFIAASLRHRILYGLFLSAILVATLFPWFRYLFWTFRGDYYRTLSLFGVLGMITLVMTVFSRYTEGERLNLWVLGAMIFALVGTLYLPLSKFQTLINPNLRVAATVFLVSYAILLAIGQVLKRPKIIAWMIVSLAVIELLYFDRITVSNRPTVTKQELNERVGYNDQTVDAVRDINASDKSFFRITKTWGSGPGIVASINDAMVFGYHGTSSYSSFNNLNYIKFLMAVDAITTADIATYTHWSMGLLGHPLLSTFACEKYLLTKNPVPFQMADHYELVRNYGDIYLFRNQLFLPFGLTFSRYLPEDTFLQLPSWAKPEALLHAIVLSEENRAEEHGLSPISVEELEHELSGTAPREMMALRRTTALTIRSFSETRINGTVQLNHRSMLLLQTPFDPGWHAFQDGRAVPTFKVDVGLLGVALDGGDHTVELRYRPPFLYAGAAVSFVSLLIIAASLWRWPRIRLPH